MCKSNMGFSVAVKWRGPHFVKALSSSLKAELMISSGYTRYPLSLKNLKHSHSATFIDSCQEVADIT
jgi:hypothetical protein